MLSTTLDKAPLEVPLKIRTICSDLLRFELLSAGVAEGDEIIILNKSPFKGPLLIQCGESLFSLPFEHAASVSTVFAANS